MPRTSAVTKPRSSRSSPKAKSTKSKASTGKDGAAKRKSHKLDYKPSKPSQQSGDAKSRRWRPGTVALREIRHLQRGTNLLIQKAPFQRLVREVMQKHKHDLRFKPSALEAMQEATEQYLIGVFEGAVILQLHRKKKTLVQKDLHYCMRIRGNL